MKAVYVRDDLFVCVCDDKGHQCFEESTSSHGGVEEMRRLGLHDKTVLAARDHRGGRTVGQTDDRHALTARYRYRIHDLTAIGLEGHCRQNIARTGPGDIIDCETAISWNGVNAAERHIGEVGKVPGERVIDADPQNIGMPCLDDGVGGSLDAAGVRGCKGLFDIVFTDGPVANYRDVKGSDQVRTARFNARLREKGILKPPGKVYPCLALTEADLEQTVDAISYTAANIDG